MANDSKEKNYGEDRAVLRSGKRVLGLGLIAATSAIAGGLAVAWWHRKTLAKLQNPIQFPEVPKPEFQNMEQETPETDEF